MEHGWGLKLAKVADEFSSANFQVSKDRADPVFVSAETDGLFTLTAHLKGYKENINIEINEEGAIIIIRGEETIQETVMLGWRVYKREKETRRFRKAFRIPDGVIRDKIKAKFNEDESILTISMPKKKKGIRGLSIEEVKEEQILASEGSENLRILPDEVPEDENELEEEHEEETDFEDEKSSKNPEIARVEEPVEARFNAAHLEETQVAEVRDMKEQEKEGNQLDQRKRLQNVSDDHAHATDRIVETKSPVHETDIAADKNPRAEDRMHRKGLGEKEVRSQGLQGKMEEEPDQPIDMKQDTEQNQHKYDEIQEEGEEPSAVVKPPEEAQKAVPSRIEEQKERCKMCTPILAGSAILLSLVVYVIHFIRSKKQPGKRKD